MAKSSPKVPPITEDVSKEELVVIILLLGVAIVGTAMFLTWVAESRGMVSTGLIGSHDNDESETVDND